MVVRCRRRGEEKIFRQPPDLAVRLPRPAMDVKWYVCIVGPTCGRQNVLDTRTGVHSRDGSVFLRLGPGALHTSYAGGTYIGPMAFWWAWDGYVLYTQYKV